MAIWSASQSENSSTSLAENQLSAIFTRSGGVRGLGKGISAGIRVETRGRKAVVALTSEGVSDGVEELFRSIKQEGQPPNQ